MFAPFQTQYPGSDGRQQRSVFVGLDFGTAFTKVVIADPTDSFAVRLRADLGGVDEYLQPGLLINDADGGFCLTDVADDRRSFQNLKLALISVPDNGIARANAALFLALVLQKARVRFLGENQEIFRSLRLDWHLNIGLPAENFDNVRLSAAFRAVAEIAWVLSVLDDSLAQHSFNIARWLAVAPKRVTDPRFNAVKDRFIDPEKIGVLPEVQAETVCYARSPLRSNGLHLLVDVGAGTLDVNVFSLSNPQGDDQYVSHRAKVFPLGSAHLARHRLSELAKQGRLGKHPAIGRFTEFAAIPGRRELAAQLAVSEDEIEQIDRAFLNRVGPAIWDVINRVRQQHPSDLHRWRRDRLTSFLAGGGSADSAYNERLNLVHYHRETYGWAGLDIRPLLKPDRRRMPGVADQSFHRLAVASGLAHDLLNLGDFIPPDPVPQAATTAGRDYRDNYVGQEQT